MRISINTFSIILATIAFMFMSPAHATTCSPNKAETLSCATEILINHGLLNEAEDGKWNVYQWPELLDKSDEVATYRVGKNKRIKIKRPSWLFYVDMWPGGAFEHSTEIILVSQKSGKIKRTTHQGFPIINGVNYFAQPIEALVKEFIPMNFKRFPLKGQFQFSEDVERNVDLPASFRNDFDLKPPITPNNKMPDSPIDYSKFQKWTTESNSEFKKRVDGYHEKAQSKAQAQKEANKCVCANPSPKRNVYIISGFNADGERDDLDELARFYRSQGDSVTFLRSKAKDFKLSGVKTQETTLPNIRTLFKKIASQSKDCCQRNLILFGGHGSLSGAIDFNPSGREEIFVGGKSQNPPRFRNIGHPKGGDLRTKDLRKLLNSIKSCLTEVYIYSCYSGKHLTNGINKLKNNLKDDGCLCRTVYTSSSHRQVTYLRDLKGIEAHLKEAKGDLKKGFLNLQHKLRQAYDKASWTIKRNPLVQSTDCLLCKDTDKDGLINGEEMKDNYSDPGKADTDGDGLSDFYEKNTSKTDPKNTDSDGDKLTDSEEVELKTNPNSEDSDGDGIKDKHEVFLQTDPNKKDTDGDGLDDGDEVAEFGTSPTNKDTDGDGFNDGFEVSQGTDPKDPESY